MGTVTLRKPSDDDSSSNDDLKVFSFDKVYDWK